MAVRLAGRGGSTSVRGRVRSPHVSGGRPAAGSHRADNLGSCATQPACYSLGWDRQKEGQTDRLRYRQGCILKKKWGTPETRLRQKFTVT